MLKSDMRAAIEAAVAEALTDQAVRIGSILRSPEVEGRHDLALTLALSTTLSAVAAFDILKAAPRATASADRFLAAMAREGDLGIDSSGAQPTGDSKATRKAELTAAARAVKATRTGTAL